MKIGILTLVNQLNYGGVLQAYALQRVLRDRGYDVEVIDYWYSQRNIDLYGEYLTASGFDWRKIALFIKKQLRVGFMFGELRRRESTISFLDKHIKLSRCSYCSAEELAFIADYDCIIVGSDQVWNYQWFGTPNPFLLGQVPSSVRKVAYAPSFGFKQLPTCRLSEYQTALNGFDFISAREKEGCEQIRSWIGRSVERVLDPSLLLTADQWASDFNLTVNRGNYIFCYWLGDLSILLPRLYTLARHQRKRIRLFVGNDIKWRGTWFRLQWYRSRMLFGLDVKLVRSADPEAFLREISQSSAVLSDSFHALMFAVTFRKPVRILTNTEKGRTDMSARMLNFVDLLELRDVVTESIECEIKFSPVSDAVSQKLEANRQKSFRFLLTSVGERCRN